MQSKSGFSLIELVIAITIMAIFAGIAIPSYLGITRKAKKDSTVSILKTLDTAVSSFHGDTGSYPNSISELVHKPSDEKIGKRWEGPYIDKEITSDGYKTDLVYRVTKGGKHPYELYSWGPNGEGSPEEEWINVWDI
jgi:general secretion pathway protein G